MAKHLRINQFIKAPTVRVISSSGEQLGIMAITRALELAVVEELDLIEVVPNANPPVCKIMDYGKYLYHQKKVEMKHRKNQKKTEVKGVRMGFKTGDHDLEVKANQAKRFLEDRNAIKVSLIFRGREIVYKDLAIQKMMKFYEFVKDISTIDTPPKIQGNMLIMILTPKS